MANFSGTSGNDTQGGTSDADVFDYSQGGADSLTGLGGNDKFYFGSQFFHNDSVEGGDGYDIVYLDGDYTIPQFPYTANTLQNVEEMDVAGGHSYKLAFDDGNVGAIERFYLDMHALKVNDYSSVDLSAESDGAYTVYGGRGLNDLYLGTGPDAVVVHGEEYVYCSGTSLPGKFLDGTHGNLFVTATFDGSASVVLNATCMTNAVNLFASTAENLGTIDISLTLVDANVASGDSLFIGESPPASGTTFNFTVDGSAETNGRLSITGGNGNDTLIGGQRADIFTPNYTAGGNDHVTGNGGNDFVHFGGTFDAGDVFDGGNGNDTLQLAGNYATVIGSSSFINIENLQLYNGFNYGLTLEDGCIAAGKTLTVDATRLASDEGCNVTVLETDGRAVMNGGAGDDNFYGGLRRDELNGGQGHGNDYLYGSLGGDTLNGGHGHDTYAYNTHLESTGPRFDTIAGFDAVDDHFNLPVATRGVEATVAQGTLDDADFNGDLEAAVGHGALRKLHAVLFTPDSGSFDGSTFLIVDANGLAGYQPNKDFVFLLTDPLNLDHLGKHNFHVAG